jgi:sugar phosphate isomerase/epimerase
LEEFEATCKLAVAVGTDLLGGSTSVLDVDRARAVALLHQYDLRLGLENHPEKTPAAMLDKIGDGGDGRIGTALDTGWYGTQGYDAAQAILDLQDHLFHVHLKDVRQVGAHETCRYGEGIVPVEACVAMLKKIGYTGAISVEHEPELFDPSDDCRANLVLLRAWLTEDKERLQ